MNKWLILGISILVLLLFFLIIFLIISKKKIVNSTIPIEIANEKINNYLKQKYKLYKEIITFIKNNLSIKEDAFKNFLEFDAKECLQNNLIDFLDKTTYEINEYVDNYDELNKNEDFLYLKKQLYNLQLNLEATIDYYNNKIIIYNELKNNAPTSICTIFFEFMDYTAISNEKKEIARLINLN